MNKNRYLVTGATTDLGKLIVKQLKANEPDCDIFGTGIGENLPELIHKVPTVRYLIPNRWKPKVKYFNGPGSKKPNYYHEATLDQLNVNAIIHLEILPNLNELENAEFAMKLMMEIKHEKLKIKVVFANMPLLFQSCKAEEINATMLTFNGESLEERAALFISTTKALLGQT